MKNKNTFLYLLLLLSILISGKSYPQAGQLDATFGQNGIVTTQINFSDHDNSVQSTAMQSDGKIVAGGYFDDGINKSFAIARYNSSGTLDNTFGTKGIVITPIGTSDSWVYSVAIQSDGKIVAAGISQIGSNAHFTLVRYNPNGTLDDSFAVDGIVTTIIGGSSFAKSVKIQSDGKIILGGFSNNDLIIARYHPNGALDNTFGTNGIVTTNIGSSCAASSLAIQSDGKILAAGNTDLVDFVLIRYNTNGDLDATFGLSGIVITNIGGSWEQASSVSLQNDGKIIVSGRSHLNSTYDFTVVRYNVNGELDNTFGTNGKVITPMAASNSSASSVKVQDDGKIVAIGSLENGNDYDFVLVRYTANGLLDHTFGTNGIVITQMGTASNFAYSVLIQSDDKIIGAGYSDDGGDDDFALVRYHPNGDIDNTFGTNGNAITPIGSSDEGSYSVEIQTDDKIVIAGFSDNGSDYDFAIVRYNSDGSLDNTFGANGIATTPIGSGDDVARSIAYQDDGKIVTGGYSSNGNGIEKNPGNYDFALVRYKTNGFIDNTFGINGIVTTPIGTESEYVTSLVCQSDEKIVAAGHSFNGNDYDFALVRYNPDGSMDNSFGTNGVVTTPIGSSHDRVYSVAIQNDGKIVTAGYSFNGNDDDFAIARYNPNGDLDNSFGKNGLVITPIGAMYDRIFSIKIQNNGKIVAAGYSENGNNDDFAIARYNLNGDLDDSFGSNGIVITPIVNSNERANSISIQTDGKIVAAGYTNYNGFHNIALVRYNQNGDLDSTFGTNGIKINGIGASNSEARCVAIQGDGNIIAAGYSEMPGYSYSVFTVVRYAGDPSTGISEDGTGYIPTAFALEQNYPNPFNPTTNIKYFISKRDKVTLKVYDVLGREVRTLVNRYQNAGTYIYQFDGGALASGTYFYDLKIGDSYAQTKKMLLIR